MWGAAGQCFNGEQIAIVLARTWVATSLRHLCEKARAAAQAVPSGGIVSYSFETIGNAICLLYKNGAPLLVTDPWLEGTCYFGSWALDHPLSPQQRTNVLASPYVWISHGHPDHLHPESLKHFSRDRIVLLGEHYNSEIRDFLKAEGFVDVRICRSKEWISIEPDLRIMCVSNLNQDTILLIDAAGVLLLNQNDSPFFGENAFFRRLCRQYASSYLLALCAVDADMMNYVDDAGRPAMGPPDPHKAGAIRDVSWRCDYLGVKNFCCSSSQHLYVRRDSVWANPYRVGWTDMQKYWCARETRLIEPFVTVSLPTGEFVRNHPSQTSDVTQVTDETGADDWDERMSDADWIQLEAFIRKHETLIPVVDFVEFVVAGEGKRFSVKPKANRGTRGVVFYCPRRSLMEVVSTGYFDDLLIGNFMRTQLVNLQLYPHFSPRIAKYGGNAKVYTRRALRQFYWHYFRRSPRAMIRFYVEQRIKFLLLPFVKKVLARLGLLEAVKEAVAARRMRNRGRRRAWIIATAAWTASMIVEQ